jgi:general secretion pathway protein G
MCEVKTIIYQAKYQAENMRRPNTTDMQNHRHGKSLHGKSLHVKSLHGKSLPGGFSSSRLSPVIRPLACQSGFTLTEILIVVIIIGFIASLIAPNLLGRFERSKEEIAKTQIEMLSSSVQSFYLDVGRCPQSIQELIQSADEKWRGPYLAKQIVPKDPWGRDYMYKCPGEHGIFDLYSLGPEGRLENTPGADGKSGDTKLKNW